jgi:hypothetical protein
MDTYIVEEPDGHKYLFEKNTEKTLFSDKQQVRLNEVHRELLGVWGLTYNRLKLLANHNINLDDLMERITKIYFLQFYDSINYYDDKNIKKRNDINYKKKKINSLRYKRYRL